MLKHIKTRKQDKQKDLKEKKKERKKEKEKFRPDISKKSPSSLIFVRFPQSNLFANQ